MKVLAPPTKCERFISSGTFFENYDITNRKLYMSEHTPLYENEEKRKENNIVETTKFEIYSTKGKMSRTHSMPISALHYHLDKTGILLLSTLVPKIKD